MKNRTVQATFMSLVLGMLIQIMVGVKRQQDEKSCEKLSKAAIDFMEKLEVWESEE